MDIKNSFAMKKKRELLGSINKRKMSLRKHMDNLKENECRLEITQITKCVFLGSLCLKPVPQLFDSPLLLEELDMKVGNVRNDSLINQEAISDDKQNTKDFCKKGNRKKCLNSPKVKKRSLKERNDSIDKAVKRENGVLGLKESARCKKRMSDKSSDTCSESSFQKSEFIDLAINSNNNTSDNNSNVENSKLDMKINEMIAETLTNQNPYEFDDDIQFEEDMINIGLRKNGKTSSLNEETHDIKTMQSLGLDYDDIERLKREPTPEIILTDSDEDAIDQLMFNIMDIKVGPNFEKNFFNSTSSDTEQFDEFSNEDSPKDDKQENTEAKHKKYIKRAPQCKICSQVFPSYMQLKKHKQAHNGDKPYLCLKCNENHTTLDELIAHLRTHQGKRPYVCKKCNKGFKTMKSLENHQPVHVLKKAVPQKKAFKCEVCGKDFRKLCDLERHTRVHTGEKPSVCNICNRRFQQAHNLNKHLLIHTKEKPFECDICNKKFGRNDVLNRHLLTHSVKKPNHCNICMKSFIRASQLLAHKEKYHKKS